MRISADNLAELGVVRDFKRDTRFPEIKSPTMILATDFEGPMVLGDPVSELMHSRVRSGGQLYGDIYDCYNRQRALGRYKSPLAQEAGDTIIALATLLTQDVSDSDMLSEAQNSKITPGADRVMDFIRANGGFGVAITSAPETMYRPLATNLGFREIFGTPFPLDGARNLLVEHGRLGTETAMVKQFLSDYCRLISDPTIQTSGQLDARIRQYLEYDLGITFDPAHKSSPDRTPTTVLGQIIESESIIGDDAKAEISGLVFEQNTDPRDDTLTVTMGDGENDRLMLATRGKLSVGINSPQAILSSKIGIVTPNAGDVLIPLFEFALREPGSAVEDIIDATNSHIMQQNIHGAYVHKGGLHSDVPEYLKLRHNRMKKALRGNQILY